jgi:hypothetical protein
MSFRRFWHHFGDGEPDDGSMASRSWPDSGLSDEVEAFLTGHLVEHLAARHEPVPVWAVLNRLAHADSNELRSLVEGFASDWVIHPSVAPPRWLASERFIAGQLLARAATQEELVQIQRSSLIPLELQLIERSKVGNLTPEQVLEAGAEALDTSRPDR